MYTQTDGQIAISDPASHSMLLFLMLVFLLALITLLILAGQGIWAIAILCLIALPIIYTAYRALHGRPKAMLKVTKEGLLAHGRLNEWGEFRSFKAKYPYISLRLKVPMKMYWHEYKIEDRKEFGRAVAQISKYLDRRDGEVAIS